MWGKSIKYQIHISIFYQIAWCLCVVLKFLCATDTACIIMASPAELAQRRKNGTEKARTAESAWKREERKQHERGKIVLFRFDGNNKLQMIHWMIHIKYPSRLLRESALNNDINLSYEIFFPLLSPFVWARTRLELKLSEFIVRLHNKERCQWAVKMEPGETLAWDNHLSPNHSGNNGLQFFLRSR